jgi:hypothetical protein
MAESNEPKQEQPEAMHAYIEVMGHQCVAGRVSDVRIGNVTMLRVDILAEGRPPQIINPTSIFRMTPCTEEQARALATRSTETITKWMLDPAAPQPALPSGASGDPEDAEYEEDDLPY